MHITINKLKNFITLQYILPSFDSHCIVVPTNPNIPELNIPPLDAEDDFVTVIILYYIIIFLTFPSCSTIQTLTKCRNTFICTSCLCLVIRAFSTFTFFTSKSVCICF